MIELTVIIGLTTAYFIAANFYQKKAVKVRTKKYLETMRKVNRGEQEMDLGFITFILFIIWLGILYNKWSKND